MSAMSRSMSSTEPDSSSQFSMEDSLEDITKESLDAAELVTEEIPYIITSDDLPTPVIATAEGFMAMQNGNLEELVLDESTIPGMPGSKLSSDEILNHNDSGYATEITDSGENMSQSEITDVLNNGTAETDEINEQDSNAKDEGVQEDIAQEDSPKEDTNKEDSSNKEDSAKPVKSKIPQRNAKLSKRTPSMDVISNGPQPSRSSLSRRRSEDSNGRSTPCTDSTNSPKVMFADPPGVYMEIPPEHTQANGIAHNPGNRAILKETATSRRRREMAHNAHHRIPEEDENDYLTPLQRKDKLIRFMKEECRRLAMLVQEREDLLEAYEEDRDRDITRAVNEKEGDIQTLTDQLNNLRGGFDELMTSHEEALSKTDTLETETKQLKDDAIKKEEESQEVYYQMFRKGQKSAEFERQEELAKLAVERPEEVSLEELLEKLADTEDQLTFWQSLQRTESYEKGDKPETEAEVKLRFLRDSMFHFLTDRANAAQHLRAMIGIMGFTEVQMKKINKALVEQKIAEKVTDKDKKKEKSKKK